MVERKPISKKLRFEVFKRDNFTCQYCGRMAPDVILEIDHIIPVANGGVNDILNLITSCMDCNRGKGKRKLSENEELKKQQQALKDLAKRKEQIEMMTEWRKELSDIQNSEAEYINSLLKERGLCFNEKGLEEIKKYIKKYGLKEVAESTEIFLNQYFVDGELKKDFDYISRICTNRRLQDKDPKIYLINKSTYYAAKKFYKDKRIVKNNILKYVSTEKGLDYVLQCIEACVNWHDFMDLLQEVQKWEQLKE